MTNMETRRLGDEQLIVLWTWLLDGYVPVAHTVADLDELEAINSNGPDATLGVDSRVRVHMPRARAA